MNEKELKEIKKTIDWSLEVVEIALKALNQIAENCHTMDDLTYCELAGRALEEIDESRKRIENS